MTDYKAFPSERVHLPEDGKVTGTYVLMFQGDGRMYINSDGAAVNNHNPAIDFRGRRYLVNLHIVRGARGVAILQGDAYIKSADNWSEATPSAHGAIRDALMAHAVSLWTPEKDAEGADADAHQNLARLEREEADLSARLKATRAEMRQHKRRLLSS